MSTPVVRAALMATLITLAALSSFPATAELPSHPQVATLLPTRAEAGFGCLEFSASDPASDCRELPTFSGFGSAVAIRNGIAFVSMPFLCCPGATVAVYGQTATGWVRTGTLRDSEPPGFGPRFGAQIAFRDGVAVIANHSFLHVFRRVNGVWTDVQKLAPPPRGGVQPANWEVISSMRFENGILAVGASNFAGDTGKNVVYLYELDASRKFVLRATLRASGSVTMDAFGADVAVAGNTVVVGEPLHDAAYVFRRRSDGSWVQTQKLVGADSSAPIETFGSAVAIDRDLIIVGAPWHECLESEVSGGAFCDRSGGGTPGPNGIGRGGAAYVFAPVGGRYVQVSKLQPSPDEHANYFMFGRRIAMMGKYVVVDAAEQSTEGDFDFGIPNGLSFVYARDGSTLTARGVTSGYVRSDSIALANNLLLVGSSFDPEGNFCQTELRACQGAGNIFDLNRFVE
jgi:hypothetical protein